MSWAKEFEALKNQLTIVILLIVVNVFIEVQAGISRTMVLTSKIPLLNKKYAICSSYSVAPSSISRETLPVSMAKKLPHYPVPVFLLAQLSVHKEFHGRGIGKISLIRR
ncbi:hypothetical protein Q4506_00670 [Colwellia sp. 4_MG-2023]|uniref:hypothetical protein n=1 Tax=unclassified Colwellia TaxID=196834 RepID=UPI0026E2626A|nr:MULTISPECIES: hypothetical protein [unclassified Colwellia]MDO6505536.1 hypothetical protein [Colwellia sp. 5_MG-2023]MDO6554168.1 hypothetical protein [Colwellia sp. 4_MG-2023]